MGDEIIKQLGFFGIIVSSVCSLLYFLAQKYIERLGFQSQTKFQLLHGKRADIVATLYSKIMALERATSTHLGPQIVGQAERIEDEVVSAGNEFIRFYQDNEVWFPENICNDLYELKDKMLIAFREQSLASRPDVGGRNAVDRYQKAMEAFQDGVNVVRPKIRTHFREILGVK